jgi:leader peptidase (prepilin peptidase) / N-methyltransferase
MNSIFYYLIFIILGLIVGNFLNILIYRLPRNIQIFGKASFCPHCNSKIKFFDNIPFISYIVLKGRCRNCKSKIGIRYPLVEILTSFFYGISYYFFGISFNLLLSFILISGLILISFIDIEHRLIPNIIVIPLFIVGLLINILLMPKNWWIILAFSFGAFFFMLIISLIYPKGMGMGDVKLSLMAGAFLVQRIIPGLFIGFLAGAVFGLMMIITKKKKIKQTIPFGPFISFGCIVAFFYGEKIINWYLGYI